MLRRGGILDYASCFVRNQPLVRMICFNFVHREINSDIFVDITKYFFL